MFTIAEQDFGGSWFRRPWLPAQTAEIQNPIPEPTVIFLALYLGTRKAVTLNSKKTGICQVTHPSVTSDNKRKQKTQNKKSEK